jgi:hypothetical protein
VCLPQVRPGFARARELVDAPTPSEIDQSPSAHAYITGQREWLKLNGTACKFISRDEEEKLCVPYLG